MANIKDITDLHNEVLDLLLEYKKEHNSDLTFRLRPADSVGNRRYLNEGRWFYGNKNGVVISFIEYVIFLEKKYYCLDVGITLDKEIIFYYGELDDELLELEDFISKKLVIDLNRFPRKNKISLKFDFDFFELSDFYISFKKLLNLVESVLNNENFQAQEYYNRINQEEFQKNLDYILKKREELKLKKEQQFPYDILKEGKTPKQVFLTDLSIKNYYAIENTSIQNLPKSAPWIFLTGKNGAGKSLILQALAIGLYGNREDNIIPKSNAAINVTYQSKAGNIYKNNTKQAKGFNSLACLACFGAFRLDVLTEGSENKSSKRSTATYGLFNHDALFKNIETELKFAFYENRGKFHALVNMLKSVIPSLERVEFDKRSRTIKYFEKNRNDETFQAVTFTELATGIKSIIAMAGDIYLRFSALMQKKLDTEEYISPEDLYGIVIIDELDLHLHPTWQKQLPTLFSTVFPNIQFIASTHSAIPILGAPEGSVLLKVNRDKASGITLERLEHLENQLEDLTPNLILSSRIFGLQDIFPITHDAEKRIRTENTMAELKENDEMMSALKSYMGTEKEEELLKIFSD